jgi:type II secretory pathway pseudopilin PulG
MGSGFGRRYGQRRSPIGISLLEVLISLFVLLSAFVIVLSLFMRSAQYQVQVESKVMSVAFAETLLDDIRDWASDYDNYSSDWSAWSNATLPEYPACSASVVVVTPSVANACSQLEQGKPAAEQLAMADSFRDLTMVVRYDGAEQFRTTLRLAEPARRVAEVKVEAATASLLQNQTTDLQASLLDSASRPIKDVTFRWTVEPLGGNGTATAFSPDTARATLRHVFVGQDGVSRFVPGPCRARAVARYRGREYEGYSSSVVLQP